jgi:hypothetical protein
MFRRHFSYSRVALLIAAIAVVSLLAWPDTRVWIIGRLKGEPRYEGLPSSSWARRIQSVYGGESPIRFRPIGSGSEPEVLLVYLEFLKHDDPQVRFIGAWGLEQARVAARGMPPDEARGVEAIIRVAIPALVQAQDDPDREVRAAAARTLWKLDPSRLASSRDAVLAILQEKPPARQPACRPWAPSLISVPRKRRGPRWSRH